MMIVGELINASRKSIREAIDARDKNTLQEVARDEADAGANYIDVNAGVFVDNEAELLKWLAELVQDVVDLPCSLDSPNPRALEHALSTHKGTAMINSISLEEKRHDQLIPILAGTDLKVVALCMSDEGMPETSDQRLKIADKLITSLVNNGVKLENIFVDPLVQPISANLNFGAEFLKAVEVILGHFPEVHIMCGLSNISYGLPQRMFLNRTFMAMAIAKGMDGAILNPLDQKMMATIDAAEALAGKDNYCLNYIKSFRDGKFTDV
jgi:5-methyltetrahydrofolate--homocysteine methyltransferase